MVTNSFYPFFLFLITLSLTSSVVVFFKYGLFVNLLLCLVSLLFCMFCWFKDVFAEGSLGHHNFFVVDGLKYGMALFIFSEVMFFSGFFWSFFDSSLVPNLELGMVWSPIGLSPINPFDIPLLNTAILLSSGVTATWAHHLILCNSDGLVYMLFTVFLGLYFTLLQGFEYSISSFTISDSIFGTTFFVATGFHGLHVIVGTIFLMVVTYRIAKVEVDSFHHVGLELSLWYWHFVDVVWLFLFSFVYWWAF